ncbi:MAG: YihY/virulence factor BrkB family protein, partial [Steroidobacteraceae bacterium]
PARDRGHDRLHPIGAPGAHGGGSRARATRGWGYRLMRGAGHRAMYVAKHPGAFTLRVLRAFRANQALLLAGAVAYYTLLSLVPLLILILIALSGIIDRSALLATLGRYLGWLIPGQSAAVVAALARFLAHRGVIGWVLLATMVFSSSLAFTVLENALAVIFPHRAGARRRRFLISAIIPYCYILFLGAGLLLMTLVSGLIQVIGATSVDFLGVSWSLHGVSGVLLYLLGVFGEIFVLTSIYLVMPVGPLSWRHALIGAVTATVLWEITRHLLVWYFGTLSELGVVYGSLTTAIVVLASLDFAATFLLLGAQVVAEYERIGAQGDNAAAPTLRT